MFSVTVFTCGFAYVTAGSGCERSRASSLLWLVLDFTLLPPRAIAHPSQVWSPSPRSPCHPALLPNPLAISLYHMCIRLSHTFQLLHLLSPKLIPRIHSWLCTRRFSDHDGGVRVVLLHCRVGTCEEGSEVIAFVSDLSAAGPCHKMRLRTSRHCYARSFGNARSAVPSASS